MKNNNTSPYKTSIISLLILVILGSITYYFHSLNTYIKSVFEKKGVSYNLIYTDIINIPTSTMIEKWKLKNYLAILNYVPQGKIPTNEGEIFENNDVIYVYRNAIKTSKLNIPKELYKIDYKKNFVSCTFSKKCDHFILDPLPIESSKNKKDKTRYLKLSSFKKELIDTLILIEDKRFYGHHGIDLKGIFRAIFVNIKNLKIKQGASTITQQLVKNLYLTREKSFKRKLKEIFLSIYIEFLYSKDEILEKYLNTVYLGQDKNTSIKGFVSGADFFFKKDVNDLSLSEIALLVGLIKAPSYYSPILHYDNSIKRKNDILKVLLENEKISKNDFEKQSLFTIKLNLHKEQKTQDSYFYDATINALKDKNLNFISTIYTGLNPLFQECAKNAISEETKKIEDMGIKNIQASIVTIESKSGNLKSYIAGKDYDESKFDRVYQAKRQLGSIIKPFVYLVAIDPTLNDYKQATAISILKDEPISFKDAIGRTWAPQNYDKKFRGYVTLREALENSLNVPTVYLANKINIKKIAKLLKKLGLNVGNENNLSISLGAVDESLLNIASAYTIFSNSGIYISPRFFIEYFDEREDKFFQSKVKQQKISASGPIYILNSILQGVFQRGTAKRAKQEGFNLHFAGKTGTSSDKKDNWFIGFNKDYVTGVWVGRDDNKEMPFTGAQTALPIWLNYTNCISKYIEDKEFLMPQSVEIKHLNKDSFLKCDEEKDGYQDCFYEYFLKED